MQCYIILYSFFLVIYLLLYSVEDAAYCNLINKLMLNKSILKANEAILSWKRSIYACMHMSLYQVSDCLTTIERKLRTHLKFKYFSFFFFLWGQQLKWWKAFIKLFLVSSGGRKIHSHPKVYFSVDFVFFRSSRKSFCDIFFFEFDMILAGVQNIKCMHINILISVCINIFLQMNNFDA